MRMRVGSKVRVTDLSGIDSNRTGTIVKNNYEIIKQEHGRYRPFDARREVLICDDFGNYFTMFKNRLIITAY